MDGSGRCRTIEVGRSEDDRGIFFATDSARCTWMDGAQPRWHTFKKISPTSRAALRPQCANARIAARFCRVNRRAVPGPVNPPPRSRLHEGVRPTIPATTCWICARVSSSRMFVTARELGDIALQVLLAHSVVDPVVATLEHRPEALDAVGVSHAPDVFPDRVLDHLAISGARRRRGASSV